VTAPTTLQRSAVAPVSSPVTREARPGSRAARMAHPRSVDVVREIAADNGVCVRPVPFRRTNMDTGQTEVIDIPCGATREDKCAPCAKRWRRLRQVQIREGWHRTTEPIEPEPVTADHKALIAYRAHLEFARADAMRAAAWDQVSEIDAAIGEADDAIAATGLRGRVAPPHTNSHDQTDKPERRKRSTKRRQDAPDLPRRPIDPRTIGHVYTAPDGTEHRPSMWFTATLDSYGRVWSDGTPVNPNTYDYRRAAWDAVAFPRLLDRFWQNLRRCVGWSVQYAGCVEPQRRLAPHAHFAIRGTIPRDTLRRVAAATYHQVWWPHIDHPRYTLDHPPTWNDATGTWTDPDTGQALTTWDAALDEIDNDPDAEPVHVARFGTQVTAEGVNPGTHHAEKTIRYITKYLTKNATDCHETTTNRQRAHLERFWAELRITPCSERCANWLLHSIQPKNAHDKLRPGQCRSRVHQRATLGLGGRRILISREWSGKTLTDHRHDARAWVKALLGITEHPADGDQDQGDEQPQPDRYAWEMARPDDPDINPLAQRLLRAISERIRWRNQLREAQTNTPTEPPADLSATTNQQPPHREKGPQWTKF